MFPERLGCFITNSQTATLSNNQITMVTKFSVFRLIFDNKVVQLLTSSIFRCAKILKKNGEFYKKQQGIFAEKCKKTPFLLILAPYIRMLYIRHNVLLQA
jgi:hypothetical protein